MPVPFIPSELWALGRWEVPPDPEVILWASGTYKNIIHKQNYSEHFGKESDFKCPVPQVSYVCHAKDSAIFPVFPTGKL